MPELKTESVVTVSAPKLQTELVFHAAGCAMGDCNTCYSCPGCTRRVGRCLRRFRPKLGEETSLCQVCYEGPPVPSVVIS